MDRSKPKADLKPCAIWHFRATKRSWPHAAKHGSTPFDRFDRYPVSPMVRAKTRQLLSSSEFDVDVFDAAVFLYTGTTPLLAVARVLYSPERGRRTSVGQPTVDSHIAHIQAGGDPMGPRQVVGLDVTSQAIGRSVGQAQRFILGLEPQRAQDRPEYLLLIQWAYSVHTSQE